MLLNFCFLLLFFIAFLSFKGGNISWKIDWMIHDKVNIFSAIKASVCCSELNQWNVFCHRMKSKWILLFSKLKKIFNQKLSNFPEFPSWIFQYWKSFVHIVKEYVSCVAFYLCHCKQCFSFNCWLSFIWKFTVLF